MLFDKKFLLLIFSCAITFQLICECDGHTDSDDHVHDHGHDGEHDAHSCHYGVTPVFPFPLAEDECASIELNGLSYSFIFECHDDNEGDVFVYNGTTTCSGDHVFEYQITDQTMFDCSTQSKCDILLIDREYYGSESTDCSGTSQIDQSFAFSTGSTCVNIGNDTYWGIKYDETNDQMTMSFYYQNANCDSADLEITFPQGCQEDKLEESGYTVLSFQIEQDDNANKFGNASTICLISLVLLVLFY